MNTFHALCGFGLLVLGMLVTFGILDNLNLGHIYGMLCIMFSWLIFTDLDNNPPRAH